MPATPLKAGLGLQTCREQGGQGTHRVADEHHLLTPNRQPVISLGLQDGIQILETIRKHLRPGGETTSLKPGAHRLGITARVIEHHDGPAVVAEQPTEPPEMIRCSSQTWH